MFFRHLFNEKDPACSSRSGFIDKLNTPCGEVLILGLFIIFGALLRYKAIPAYQVIAADGPSYIAIAKEIVTNHTARSSIHYPPFYPFLIAVVSLVTKDFESAGVLVSLFAGSLLVVPVFLLGKALFDRSTGYIAAALVLVWPEFVGQSSNVLAYSTYFTALLTGLYFLWAAHSRGRNGQAVLSGIFIAAAYLSRQEAFISMSAICFSLAAVSIYRERSLVRIKPLVVAFGTFCLLVSPYIWMVHQVMGVWTLAGKSVVTLTDCLSYYLKIPDLHRNPDFTRIGILDIIRTYPGYLPYSIRKNSAELIAILPDPLIIFATVGFLVKQKKPLQLQIRFFILAAVSPVITLVVFFLVSGAYIAPYLPFLFMLCGHGMLSTERFMADIFGRYLPAVCKRACVLTGFIILAYAARSAWVIMPHGAPGPYHLEMDGGRYDHKLIGLMLKKMIPAGTTIMTRSGRIGFYSGLPWVDVPQSDLATILRTAREKKVRYLIVDGMLANLRPQMGILLWPLEGGKAAGMEIFQDPVEVMPGILRRAVYTDYESQGVVVYELSP